MAIWSISTRQILASDCSSPEAEGARSDYTVSTNRCPASAGRKLIPKLVACFDRTTAETSPCHSRLARNVAMDVDRPASALLERRGPAGANYDESDGMGGAGQSLVIADEGCHAVAQK
jgi:hypothetical protein